MLFSSRENNQLFQDIFILFFALLKTIPCFSLPNGWKRYHWFEMVHVFYDLTIDIEIIMAYPEITSRTVLLVHRCLHYDHVIFKLIDFTYILQIVNPCYEI